MLQVNIQEAKTNLLRLLARVAAGEQILISNAGRPVARLVPVKRSRGRKRRLGQCRGQVRIAPDFDGPLPPEIQKYFE